MATSEEMIADGWEPIKPIPDYGKRNDGTTKGQGWLGPQKMIAQGWEPIETPKPSDEPKPPMSWGQRAADTIAGIPEAAMTMGSSMIAKPISDIAGLAATGVEAIDPSGVSPDDYRKHVQNALTYSPRTEAGKAITTSPINPLVALGKGTDIVAGKAGSAVRGIGNDATTFRGMAGNAVEEGIKHLPGILGAKYADMEAAKLPTKQAALDVVKGENSIKDSIRDTGQAAGLITPIEGTSVITGIPGIKKSNDWVASANEKNVTKFAKQDLDIPDQVPLTPDQFSAYRSKQGNAYRNVEAAGDKLETTIQIPQGQSRVIGPTGEPMPLPPLKRKLKGFMLDSEFSDKIGEMSSELNALKNARPETFKSLEGPIKLLTDYGDEASPVMSGNEMMKAIRKLRKDATTEFKSDDPMKVSTAFIRKDVASELENLIERNLEASGNSELLNEFRKARVNIAKSYNIEAATDVSGKVNANKLKVLNIKSGRSFTGKIKLLADFAEEFPEAVKPMGSAKQGLGMWDWLLAGGAAVSGHPLLGLGEVAGRFGIPWAAGKGLLQKKTPNYKATAPTAMPAAAIGIGTTEEARRNE